MSRRLRQLCITFTAILPLIGLALVALWILFDSARTEGLWNTMFLQTEKARSAYLISMAALCGGTLLCLMALAVAAMVTRRRSSLVSARAPEEPCSRAALQVCSAPGRGRWRRRLEWAFEGLLPAGMGLIGVSLEIRKSGEERVWWVLILFVALLASGVLVLVGRSRV